MSAAPDSEVALVSVAADLAQQVLVSARAWVAIRDASPGTKHVAKAVAELDATTRAWIDAESMAKAARQRDLEEQRKRLGLSP